MVCFSFRLLFFSRMFKLPAFFHKNNILPFLPNANSLVFTLISVFPDMASPPYIEWIYMPGLIKKVTKYYKTPIESSFMDIIKYTG